MREVAPNENRGGRDSARGAGFALAGVGFFECFHGAARREAVGRAHAVQDKDTVEVVGLVLADAGGQVLEDGFEGTAFDVLGGDAAALGTAHLGVDAGKREAAFLALDGAVRVVDGGVHQDEIVAGFAGGIHDEEALVDTHLRGSQPDAASGQHQFEHAPGQGGEVGVKLGDRLARAAESRIGVVDNVEFVEILHGTTHQHPSRGDFDPRAAPARGVDTAYRAILGATAARFKTAGRARRPEQHGRTSVGY